MNVQQYHRIVDQYYPDPILKTYEPSKYQIDRATTPARKRKLDAEILKENKKLQDIYTKDVEAKKKVHDIIDELITYPEQIAQLFLSTIQHTINDISYRHDSYLQHKRIMLEEYGDDCLSHKGALYYLAYERVRFSKKIYAKSVTKEEWETFSKNHYIYKTDKYKYPYNDIKDHNKFLDDYRTYYKLCENDEVQAKGFTAYKDAIIHMVSNLERICEDIKTYFGNNKPTSCITDPSWGIDGHFNGILTDGTTKISFLSFDAGGYNIQKYHYRFKITKLKS